MIDVLKEREGIILDFIKLNPSISSKEIHDGLGLPLSYATVKRTIQKLLSENLLTTLGKGKGTKYRISESYQLLRVIDVEQYFRKEIDERKIRDGYNHSLIRESLANVSIFTPVEFERLNRLQNIFRENISKLQESEYQMELDRLAIDLSWKSSQIEGNTYSLLETERLLKERETASGKTREEATMLLNHKAALDFIIADPTYVNPLSVRGIEDIHSILISELSVARNVRKGRVGISGTNYKPLDNEYQIREALEDMCVLINKQEFAPAKALLALALISYIQAFADGNKRTARIISNALLINHHYCPVSFRTVNPLDYKKAVLLFYEQNNISAIKQIFLDQVEFAVKTYF